MQRVIDLLIQNEVIEQRKLDLFITKYGEERVNIENLIKVKILSVVQMEEMLIKELRMHSVEMKDLESINGIDTTRILKRIANNLAIEYVDINDVDLDHKLIERLPLKQLMRYNALPLYEDDQSRVTVAFENPSDFEAKGAIERFFRGKIMVVAIANANMIKRELMKLKTSEEVVEYSEDIKHDLTEGSAEVKEVKEGAEDSSAVLKLIETILSTAISSMASDIHIEATEESAIVRYRVDGMLQEYFKLEKIIFGPLASRTKLLSNLDIAEKRKPQDGRFTHIVNGAVYDFRVSTLPTMFGESIVMRILDKSKALVKLEDAGMNAEAYKKFKKGIKSPYGIMLVTGPTGSGKTTTLYGALNAIIDVRDKIITVEDPVEYQMDGIQQVQVSAKTGLTFAAALRSILRQDPDKIMIGEIRDQETLRIAIEAALTGHLVLSTLHTNDSISAISRMQDMGIEDYLLAGAVIGIQGQRLVRKICGTCKEVEQDIEADNLKELAKYLPQNPIFYKGKGCAVCNNSGYAGREMICEVLIISEELSTMIANGATKDEMRTQAMSEGFTNMLEDGVNKALQGKTSLEEVLRVAR
ncbi:type II/IV secretion system protein [Sulfurovum sp. bin170]|uniref:GspE/PulE family protein n=1 Tax=Sulfurovum sp. bin170 TaxID=2695268 RepID=UPI0013E02A04|nr:GspE/PulE family protein [Sulfurovum sp. bin170]NEW61178.1 type II/IV secretion system protein [Sulfurovum sp. bin170]